MLQIIPLQKRQWTLSFQILILGIVDAWSSVLHLTAGSNKQSHGDRTPAIWLNPGESTMSFYSSFNGDYNLFLKSHWLAIGEKVSVNVTQSYLSEDVYRFAIYIDGNEIFSRANNDARSFENVKVYAGDPWYQPAKAILSDFSFQKFVTVLSLEICLFKMTKSVFMLSSIKCVTTAD